MPKDDDLSAEQIFKAIFYDEVVARKAIPGIVPKSEDEYWLTLGDLKFDDADNDVIKIGRSSTSQYAIRSKNYRVEVGSLSKETAINWKDPVRVYDRKSNTEITDPETIKGILEEMVKSMPKFTVFSARQDAPRVAQAILYQQYQGGSLAAHTGRFTLFTKPTTKPKSASMNEDESLHVGVLVDSSNGSGHQTSSVAILTQLLEREKAGEIVLPEVIPVLYRPNSRDCNVASLVRDSLTDSAKKKHVFLLVPIDELKEKVQEKTIVISDRESLDVSTLDKIMALVRPTKYLISGAGLFDPILGDKPPIEFAKKDYYELEYRNADTVDKYTMATSTTTGKPRLIKNKEGNFVLCGVKDGKLKHTEMGNINDPGNVLLRSVSLSGRYVVNVDSGSPLFERLSKGHDHLSPSERRKKTELSILELAPNVDVITQLQPFGWRGTGDRWIRSSEKEGTFATSPEPIVIYKREPDGSFSNQQLDMPCAIIPRSSDKKSSDLPETKPFESNPLQVLMYPPTAWKHDREGYSYSHTLDALRKLDRPVNVTIMGCTGKILDSLKQKYPELTITPQPRVTQQEFSNLMKKTDLVLAEGANTIGLAAELNKPFLIIPCKEGNTHYPTFPSGKEMEQYKWIMANEKDLSVSLPRLIDGGLTDYFQAVFKSVNNPENNLVNVALKSIKENHQLTMGESAAAAADQKDTSRPS